METIDGESGQKYKVRHNIYVIGAGPAGLTAAYEVLKRQQSENNKEQDIVYKVTVIESTNCIGGISKTVNYKGNMMDMGGHRFYSKSKEINKWWNSMMPLQTEPAYDDKGLNRNVKLAKRKDSKNIDPEINNNVMLRRDRVSRIYFDGKFFDYPIRLSPDLFKNMGLKNTTEAVLSYCKEAVKTKGDKIDNSLEDFYVHRFGKKLYQMFFEHYTENLWGRHPRDIDPSWGAQRAKGLSIPAIIKDIASDMINKTIFRGKKHRKTETSLIENFKYPKYGPGQMWETTAQKIKELGGVIEMNTTVAGLELSTLEKEQRITGLIVENKDKNKDNKVMELIQINAGDIVISSMSLKDLIHSMNDVPINIKAIGEGLPYRDYITIGALIPIDKLKLKRTNKDRRTIGNILPDNWVYVHDRSVDMGRFQVYNNWSPYMVKDINQNVWIGLEYFCTEGDSMWEMSEQEFTEKAKQEMVRIGIIGDTEDVVDTHIEKIRKAYPAYFDTYKDIDELKEWLLGIDNLYCVGRNGQHRYNNMDHSMMTSIFTVDTIMKKDRLLSSYEESGKESFNLINEKRKIWDVNTEQEYGETKN